MDAFCSSTAVRDNIAAGKSVNYLVTDGVAGYIQAAGLYAKKPKL